MTVRIYHNPRCSKSRQTLQLLKDKGIEPEVIEYLDNPPSVAELTRILELLGMTARALMRRGETVYKEAGLDDATLTEEALLEAMVKNPILIQRPIVLSKGRAAIGRPPESVVDIL